MRVGVNCFPLLPHIGGMKQQFLMLFDYLLRNDSDNQYVFFCFPHNSSELKNLQSDRWRENAIHLVHQDDIRRHLSSLDVYFCAFGVLWPRPVPVPSVVMLPDIQEKVFPEFFSRTDLFSRAYHFKGSTTAADVVITLSEFSKSSIRRFHKIPPEKIAICHLCADPRYFDQQLACAAGPLPFSSYLLYPANFWLHKNHERLLRALRILKDKGLEINTVLTGFEMEGGCPVAKMAREYGIEDRVYVAGYVSAAELVYLYSHARLLVFPSLFEGFGMPALEAMATGCAAVVSSATSLPEICGDAALYFDPFSEHDIASAIEKVWINESLRRDLSARGRQRAAQFSIDRMAATHLDVFRLAQQRYSYLRYGWQRYMRQPIHRHVTHAAHWASERFRKPRPGECLVSFVSGWHQPETDGSHSLRWTNGRGRLIVRTPGEVELGIHAETASLPDSNGVDLKLNGKLAARWKVHRGGAVFEAAPSIILKLQAGRNVVEFVSWRHGVSAGSDPRTLAIAVKDLSFQDPFGRVKCRVG